MTGRTQIWSSGGGVQSTAIAAMIVRGELEKPDLAVISDTERECSTTWEYLEDWVVPALASVGVTMHRVRKSEFATVDLWRNGDLLIPAFTTVNGRVGKLPTFCSNEWKSRVVERWATRVHGVTAATLWIGFSADEEWRAWRRKEGETEKWHVRFPLLDARMRRYHCLTKVAEVGWPEPPASCCWMCPNMDLKQRLKVMSSQDASKAVAFEREIQEIDPDVWLTKHAKPIGSVDFTSAQLDMFEHGCESGQCFV
jgi:hypothetical protein